MIKDKRLQLRLTEADIKSLEKVRACLQGESLSAWIRRVLRAAAAKMEVKP